MEAGATRCAITDEQNQFTKTKFNLDAGWCKNFVWLLDFPGLVLFVVHLDDLVSVMN